jgi:deoxycytidylate deaminase
VLLAFESNRCDPPDGICRRIGRTDARELYPVESECNWTHAEIMALRALDENAKPVKAVIYGHNFACPSCEAALHSAGINQIVIVT